MADVSVGVDISAEDVRTYENHTLGRGCGRVLPQPISSARRRISFGTGTVFAYPPHAAPPPGLKQDGVRQGKRTVSTTVAIVAG